MPASPLGGTVVKATGARDLGVPVPFDTYHRDDQPSALRHAYDTPPVVVAELDAGFVVLLGPKELAECRGSVDSLMEAIEHAVIQTGLTWPE